MFRAPLLVLTCALVLNILPLIPSRAVAAGVDSSGGGSIRRPRPLTPEELRWKIDALDDWNSTETLSSFFVNVKAEPLKHAYVNAVYRETRSRLDPASEKTRYVPTRFDWVFDPGFPANRVEKSDPVTSRIIRTLFPENGERNIIDVLKWVKYTLKEKGPCYDDEGTPVQASGYPYDSPEICFSAELLLPELNQENADRHLLALAAHEVSHKLLKRDEASTKHLQDQFLDEPVHSYLRAHDAQELAGRIIRSMTRIAERIQQDQTIDCPSLLMLNQELLMLYKGHLGLPDGYYSVSGIRLENEMELGAIWAKTYLMQLACEQEGDPHREFLMRYFSSQKELPLREFMLRFYADATANPANGMAVPPLTPFQEKISPLAHQDVAGTERLAIELRDRASALSQAIYWATKRDVIF